MKSKMTITIAKALRNFGALLVLLLFTFCSSETENIDHSREPGITKDARVVALLLEAVQDNSVQTKSTSDTNQCTNFRYPMTLEVFPGDDTESIDLTINNDEELIDFLTTLTTTYEFYINWPLTLVDVDGIETNIDSLDELVGTLEVIIEACDSANDDGDGDDGNDDSDDGLSDGSDDDKYDFCSDNNKKVYICHKGKTICVSINAIWGHLAHHSEDYLGQCQ
tara:strand:- start:102848 stop:103516 length:669 start_codon:yes stop_codon:yes gene_type:complete